MLVIEAVRRARRVPVLLILGLGLMAIGGIADVVPHVVVTAAHHVHGAGADPTGHVAHLIGIAGMVLVFAGVVAHGIRSTRRRPAARIGGSDRDAHR